MQTSHIYRILDLALLVSCTTILERLSVYSFYSTLHFSLDIEIQIRHFYRIPDLELIHEYQ